MPTEALEFLTVTLLKNSGPFKNSSSSSSNLIVGHSRHIDDPTKAELIIPSTTESKSTSTLGGLSIGTDGATFPSLPSPQFVPIHSYG